MTLTEFIKEKIAVALNYRGLSELNPVEIIVEGNGKKFVVLVSLLEPDTLTVPYNVTWINADPEHEDYEVLLRRVDAEKYDDKDYRGSWAVLSTVEEIFNEEQYFKKDADPILGAVPDFRPSLASTTTLGGFRLSVNVADEEDLEAPIVVGTNDSRLSNARTPTTHSHPDIPRTMLSCGDGSDNYVLVPSTDAPAGTLLFITEELEDGNFIAEWLPPTTEFAYLGPRPASIAVTGPAEHVRGDTNHVLRADVTMDDNTKLFSVKATWSVVNNGDYGTINPATGVFHANLVAVDTPVTVRASYTHPESGDTVYVDFVITIIGDPDLVLLTSIAINGPDEFLKSTTGTYTVVATFSDSSTLTVTPNTFVSSNAQAGTFAAGVLTPRPQQIRDVSTRLTASYSIGGVTRTAQKDVVVKDPTVYPDSIAITGPTTVDQASSITLKGHVVFSNATEADVNALWTLASTVYATIDQNGVLTAKPLTVPGSKSVVVNVSYTSNGVTVTAQKTIGIADTKNWPVSGAITGPNTLAPLETKQYLYVVTYLDGSTVEKIPGEWTTSNTAFATVQATGEVTGVANGAVNIRATYTEDGINLNATKPITVVTGTVTIPPLRYGVAMFSNKQFTGGPIASEITQEERDFGVTEEFSASGKQYTHWTGIQDFVEKVMTNTLSLQPGEAEKNIETTITVDDYTYLMWDARAGDTFIVDLQNSFNVTFDGINYRNDVIGNEEGLPEYDPALPKQLTVQYDDGTGVRPWIIVRNEATTLPEFSPRTNQYSIKYV